MTATPYESSPFKLIRPSWEGLKLNLGPYAALIGLVWAASIVAVGLIILILFLPIPGLKLLAGLVVGGAWLYYVITRFLPATVRLQLAMARHQPLTVRQAFTGPARIGWRLLGVGLMTGLICLGGLLLLVVPAFIFGTWLSLAPYAVVEEDLGVMAALSRSRQLVKNRFWDVFGIACLYEALAILYLLPIVGSLAVIVLGIVFAPVSAMRYLQLVELKHTSDGRDVRTSPDNYWVILLAFLGLLASFHYGAQYPSPSRPPVEKTSGPY